MNRDNKIITLSLSPSDIASISDVFVSDYIMNQRTKLPVLSQFAKVIELKDGFNSCYCPTTSEADIRICTVSPGATVPESDFQFNAQVVYPSKKACYIPIFMEAWEQSSKPIMSLLLDQISESFYVNQDIEFLNELLSIKKETITTFLGGTLGTSSSVPIISIDSISGATLAGCDYCQGKILLTGSVDTCTIVVSCSEKLNSSGLYVDTTSKSSLTVDDILSLRGSMNSHTISPNCLFLNEKTLQNLCKDSTFLALFKPVGQDATKGEIGTLLNLRLFQSLVIPESCAILADSERMGYCLTSRNIEANIKENLTNDRKDLRLFYEGIFSSGDSLSIGAICNLASDAASLGVM